MKVVDVPAASGPNWIKLAWHHHFKSAPLQWISLTAAYMLIALTAQGLGAIGIAMFKILNPAILAGFMIAAHNQTKGEQPQPQDLGAGFVVNFRALLMLGCIIAMLGALLDLGMNSLGMPQLAAQSKPDGSPDMEAMRQLIRDKAGIIVLGTLITLVLSGALWYTTPLLAFNNTMGVGAAIRWSAYAFVSNFGALFVYALVLSVIMVAAILPLGLGLIVALPLAFISQYAAYRSMFVEAPAEPPAEQA